MELTINKQVGKNTYSFTFSGENLFDVIMKSQHLSFPNISRCGMKDCESDNLYFRAYITKEKKFQYVVITCAGCKSKLTLGKKTEDGTYYLRREPSTGAISWEAPKAKVEPFSNPPPPGLRQDSMEPGF